MVLEVMFYWIEHQTVNLAPSQASRFDSCHLHMNATLAKRLDLAQCKWTPPEILVELYEDEDMEVRRWAVCNRNFPSHMLDVLAVDGDLYFQQQTAIHRNASLDALAKLSRHPMWSVRIRVAENPRTPPEILTELAEDIRDGTYNEIQLSVKRNPNTPPLVKLWLQTGYGNMSLKEFLEAAACTTT